MQAMLKFGHGGQEVLCELCSTGWITVLLQNRIMFRNTLKHNRLQKYLVQWRNMYLEPLCQGYTGSGIRPVLAEHHLSPINIL